MRRKAKQLKRASRSSRSAPDYLLVETGKSRTPRPEEAVQNLLQV